MSVRIRASPIPSPMACNPGGPTPEPADPLPWGWRDPSLPRGKRPHCHSPHPSQPVPCPGVPPKRERTCVSFPAAPNSPLDPCPGGGLELVPPRSKRPHIPPALFQAQLPAYALIPPPVRTYLHPPVHITFLQQTLQHSIKAAPGVGHLQICSGKCNSDTWSPERDSGRGTCAFPHSQPLHSPAQLCTSQRAPPTGMACLALECSHLQGGAAEEELNTSYNWPERRG